MSATGGPTAGRVIADLYAYGDWANERLLDSAERLAEPDLRRRFSEGALPILESFVHLTSADRRWFARFQGRPLPPGLTVTDLPSIAAVRKAWGDLAAERRAYMTGLDEAALGATIRWQDGQEMREMPRWQGLVQCANHGTQHRSEIAAMLTDCSQSPGDLDFGLWCRTAR